MNTRTVKPATEPLGLDMAGRPVALQDILKDPVYGWERIKFFSHVGVMTFWTAKLYNREIPEHEFFSHKPLEIITDENMLHESGGMVC